MDTNNLFSKLKAVLEIYESSLIVVHNTSDNYYLNTSIINKNKKPEFFGAVQIKKSYVAFHLMPIYYHPELLDTISVELKSKMQGKSCFNFKVIDNNHIEELAGITRMSFEKYASLNLI